MEDDQRSPVPNDKPLRLVVFDQTRPTDASTLGRWVFMETALFQLITALEYPFSERYPGASSRLYCVKGDAWREVRLPEIHDVHWNLDLDGERLLQRDEATAYLERGEAIQIFIFNGDADVVRHYLVVPLPPPVFWLPDEP